MSTVPGFCDNCHVLPPPPFAYCRHRRNGVGIRLAPAFDLNVMSTVTKASVYSRTEDTPDTPSLASIDRFLDAVWMERGLSPNTLSAYRADLTALDRWLQGRGCSSLAAKRADVLAFIAFRVEAGARPRSTARQLSSFRRYYRYLIREGAIKEDPTAQIAMPKIGRSLPKSLTEEEVESLLNAPEIGRASCRERV